MSFSLYGNRLFYFFLFYSSLFLLGKVDDVLEITTNLPFLSRYHSQINTMEMIQGALYLILTFFLYKEIRSSKKEVDLALFALHDLRNRNSALENDPGSFWKNANRAMEGWGFTDSEKEISLLLLRGFSNRQISAVRGKSLRTIENQTFSIYQKSGMRGKVEFISYFISPLLPEEE